jgi:hypothetical protein
MSASRSLPETGMLDRYGERSAIDVEWHLGNVFTKLGIASRKDLR